MKTITVLEGCQEVFKAYQKNRQEGDKSFSANGCLEIKISHIDIVPSDGNIELSMSKSDIRVLLLKVFSAAGIPCEISFPKEFY